MIDGVSIQKQPNKKRNGVGSVLPKGLADTISTPSSFKIHRMKRFTEAFKWNDPWFRKLAPTQKLFWSYICDNCDNAGVWKIDFEMASFQIGGIVGIDIIPAINNKKERVKIFDNEELLLVKDYINFQIGNICTKCPTNLQINCVRLVKNYIENKGLSESDFNLRGSLDQAKTKRRGISKGKGKGKVSKERIYKLNNDEKNHSTFKPV